MKERDYLEDLAEIRMMMQRSSKFLSLSGWAGIMAGIYALVGAYMAYMLFNFRPSDILYAAPDTGKLILLGSIILIVSIGTAMLLSRQRAQKKGESAWNNTSRRMLIAMAIPLLTGGLILLVLLSYELAAFLIPVSLVFYGMALFNAGHFTFREVQMLGICQSALGILALIFIPYSVLIWAVGFGLMNMVYGIYIHLKYER